MSTLHIQISSVHREDGRVFVAARNRGDDLILGDILTWPGGAGPSGIVRVDALLTNRHYLNILNPGLTGELELSGSSASLLRSDVDLVGEGTAPSPEVAVLGIGDSHVRPV